MWRQGVGVRGWYRQWCSHSLQMQPGRTRAAIAEQPCDGRAQYVFAGVKQPVETFFPREHGLCLQVKLHDLRATVSYGPGLSIEKDTYPIEASCLSCPSPRAVGQQDRHARTILCRGTSRESLWPRQLPAARAVPSSPRPGVHTAPQHKDVILARSAFREHENISWECP